MASRAVQGPWQISGCQDKGFAGAVLIPALAEGANLFTTLRSLAANPPDLLRRFLVLVVVNQRTDARQQDQADNLVTLDRLAAKDPPLAQLQLAWVDAATKGMELPAKTGGVGLARKIGADLALPLLDYRTDDPLLIYLDADTLVRPDYLPAIARHFRHSRPGGAVIPFRHQQGHTAAGQEAIDSYELFLRSYVLGLGPKRVLMDPIRAEFPDRIYDPPISEAAIVSIGAGAAMAGARPFVDIGTGSFTYVGWSLFWLSLWDIFVTVDYMLLLSRRMDLPSMPLTLLGSALVVLTSFRNSSAYNRWWEARTLWGTMTNNSRSYARQVLALIDAVEVGRAKMELVQALAQEEVLSKTLRRLDTLSSQGIVAERQSQTPTRPMSTDKSVEEGVGSQLLGRS